MTQLRLGVVKAQDVRAILVEAYTPDGQRSD